MLGQMIRSCRSSPRLVDGFTLVEVLVTLAILVIIIVSVAPSFGRQIELQRLRSITAQLVTDLQYARSEAVQRNTLMRISFSSNDQYTCYTIYTSSDNSKRCDCTRPDADVCTTDTSSPPPAKQPTTEVRTVRIPKSGKVQVNIPNTEYDTAFAFDNVTGGLFVIPTDDIASPFDQILIESFIDNARKLQVRLNRAGRSSICQPSGSSVSEVPCAN